MTQRTYGKKFDWVEGNRRTLEMEEFGKDGVKPGKDGDKPRKEKGDWRGTDLGGEN